MTDAREYLIDLLVSAEMEWYEQHPRLKPDVPEMRQDAGDAVDAFAHQLAEKIRDRIGRFDLPFESERTKEFVAFGRSMADLIDPEVGE